jgi:hypothetical protein
MARIKLKLTKAQRKEAIKEAEEALIRKCNRETLTKRLEKILKDGKRMGFNTVNMRDGLISIY